MWNRIWLAHVEKERWGRRWIKYPMWLEGQKKSHCNSMSKKWKTEMIYACCTTWMSWSWSFTQQRRDKGAEPKYGIWVERSKRRKEKWWSLDECQTLANEGQTRAQSRALGSWASFYGAFLGERADMFLQPAILVWLEWSEAPSKLIVLRLGSGGGWVGVGDVGVLRDKETTKEMLVPWGIGLQGWGSPSLASFTGYIPQARLI